MKFEELPKSDDKGRSLTVENAIVKKVEITTEDHGLLTAYLHVEFDGGGCGFGGFKLGNADRSNLIMEKNYCAEFLARCIHTICGFGRWESLEGRPLRVLHEGIGGGGIVAIGHYLKNEWFCPKVEWRK